MTFTVSCSLTLAARSRGAVALLASAGDVKVRGAHRLRDASPPAC